MSVPLMFYYLVLFFVIPTYLLAKLQLSFDFRQSLGTQLQHYTCNDDLFSKKRSHAVTLSVSVRSLFPCPLFSLADAYQDSYPKLTSPISFLDNGGVHGVAILVF